MWKAGLSEAGSEALMTSLTGEMLAGQPELAVAELALFGFIMAGKKIADHHREKKQRKQDEKNAQNAREEAERQAIQQEEEEKKRQEDEYQAQLQKQREEEQQAEEARIKAEEEQKQREIEEQARQREQEAQEQRQHIHDQNQQVIQQEVDQEFRAVSDLELQREERLAIFHGQVDGNAPNGGGGYPNNGGGGEDPFILPNDDPNDPDGDEDYIILDPDGQPARNQYSNPFWEMIGKATAQIAQQVLRQKQDDEETQKKIIEDAPEVPTEEEKIQIDEQKQTHEDLNQITDNQNIIQQQILDILTGLGNEELTLEESLAELDKIQQDLDKIIGSQVKTTQIYSSSLRTF